MISIIIPTYQHADDIAACIKSVFGQTYKDFEVIVVDDGSTDNTAEALKPYLDRITLITQLNSGGNAARNRGFAASKGEFVLFCDADLILNPCYLEKALQALRDNPEASYAYPAFRFGWKTFRFWDFDAATLKRLNYIPTSSLIRREHFPGFDEKIRKFQDWDLWLTMLEAGHTGVYIPEIMFQAIPHKGGISNWIPRFFHHVPWKKFGWKVMSIEKYRDAEKIIREKHGLSNEASEGEKEWRFFLKACAALIGFEVLSYIGFFTEIRGVTLGAPLMVLGLVAVAVLAWKRISIAMLVVLADLFIGSQGGAMFAIDLGGLSLSWRMGLFMAVGTVFAARTALALIKRDASASASPNRVSALAWWSALKTKKILWSYLALIAVVIAATVRGIMLGYGFGQVFFDMNGYLYLLFLPPLVQAFCEDGQMWRKARALLIAGMVTVSLKALLVLYVFSHRLGEVMLPMYKWVRDTRVGEITRMGETDFYRVFFQSQLFPAVFVLGVLLWLAMVATRRESGLRRAFVLLSLLMSTIILGLSRSFWVGIFCALIVGVVMFVWKRATFREWRRVVGFGLGTALLGAVIVAGAYALPIPARTGEFSLTMLLSDRATSFSGEAAANSRWALLPELGKVGLEHPVLGSGFGRAVTYVTSDPRILSFIPSGVYSTVAFEWGYHDLWIKMGVLGIIIYAWFIFAVLRSHAQALRTSKNVESMTAILAVAVLLGTHVFSPYLNHPLGIGLLLLIGVWGMKKPITAEQA